MKFYESCTRVQLDPDKPIVIRVDGKSFHTWTRGLTRPFDQKFVCAMDRAATNLVATVQGAVVAYVQSDEISVVVPARRKELSQPWFGGDLQKIVSVSASVAASTLSMMSSRLFAGSERLAFFDGRAFNVPSAVEAYNCLLWRQRDAIRNAVSAAGQAVFSHRELQGRSTDEVKAMLAAKGHVWETVEPGLRLGRWVTRQVYDGPNNSVRHRWQCTAAPQFEDNTQQLMALLDAGAMHIQCPDGIV